MTRRTIAVVLAVGLAAALPCTGHAQTRAAPTEAARSEARERFDRGMSLFNGGDNPGALVEFRRAYELVENVTVLYNIGLVYAQMGRPVEATDALDQLLASPGALSPDRLAIARKTRDEQASRIAEVDLQANVAGARVEVDGVEVATTPLAGALRVPGGTHVIGLVAPGYSPQRKEVAIPGGQKQSVQFELVAMQGRLAHLAVKTHVPGADLYADDQRIGVTPLSASVTLAPGVHRIELRRAGYISARTDITLSDGATGEVTLEPEEDRAAPASGGQLALDVTESQPVVTIDGRTHGVYTSPLHLVAGPHHLLVERGDFEPAERDVTIDAGRTTSVRVTLEPTPEFRTRFIARAQGQRTWGLVSLIGGAAVLGGGIGLVVYDRGQRADGTAAQQTIASENVAGGVCDPAQDTTTPAFQMGCVTPLNAANAKVGDANTRDYAAWSAVGVGGAGTLLGVILLVTSDDPSKYDTPKSAPDGSAILHLVPTFWTTRGGGGAGLVGSF
jgi:hypothetical protein